MKRKLQFKNREISRRKWKIKSNDKRSKDYEYSKSKRSKNNNFKNSKKIESNNSFNLER